MTFIYLLLSSYRSNVKIVYCNFNSMMDLTYLFSRNALLNAYNAIFLSFSLLILLNNGIIIQKKNKDWGRVLKTRYNMVINKKYINDPINNNNNNI